MSALISLAGVAVLLLPAWLLSSDRGAIRVRTVVGAFLVQAGLGAFVLYFPLGQRALVAVTRVVQAVMDSAQAGMDFLFGGLVGDAAAEGGLGIIFAFSVLPLIIFFSSLIADDFTPALLSGDDGNALLARWESVLPERGPGRVRGTGSGAPLPDRRLLHGRSGGASDGEDHEAGAGDARRPGRGARRSR